MQEREVQFIQSCLASGQPVLVVYNGQTYQVHGCQVVGGHIQFGLIMPPDVQVVDANRLTLTGRVN